MRRSQPTARNTCCALLLAALLLSCERIRQKGEELGEKAKEKSEELADKAIPQFDAHTPDTKFNKQRFKDFLQVELTPDVKNIYCFDDAIGIDADYQFSFNCDTSTARRIIEKHHLTRDTAGNFAFGLQHDFPWWDKKKIEQLPLHSWKGEREYYKYFWYDPAERKAYYFEFDM